MSLLIVRQPVGASETSHGFQPPIYPVVPVGTGGSEVPSIPMFLDLTGFPVGNPSAAVRMVWKADALQVVVHWNDEERVLKPEISVSEFKFWMQDHLDFRVVRPNDGAVWQVTLAADGRWKDSSGLWNLADSGIRAQRKGRKTEIIVPSKYLGVDRLEIGQTFQGLIAITTWSAGWPTYESSSATEIGFGQIERYGEWRIADSLPVSMVIDDGWPVLLRDGRPVSEGVVTWSLTSGGDVERTLRQELTEGDHSKMRLPMMGSFPDFVRVGATWTDRAGVSHPLGAVTYRAPLERLVYRGDGLLFSPEDLERLRTKMTAPPFDRVADRLDSVEEFLADLPELRRGEAIPLTFSCSCMNWFRVGKETMLRDGEQNRKPSARRIWELQTKQAQETWKALVAAVTPKPEHFDVLIPELNRLLSLRELYEPTAFRDVHLPGDGRALLAKGLDNLNEVELIRFNRILLQSSVECILPFRTDLVRTIGRCFRRWVAEPDDRIIQAANGAVQAASHATILSSEFHLQEGMAAAGLGLAYDAFRSKLSEEDRRAWKNLIDRYLTLYLETAEQKAWTLTTLANANPVGNSGAGLLALAIAEEEPELSARVLNHVRVLLWRWLDSCQGPDGGNTEGMQYWQYAMENFIPFALACERATGTDDGLLSHPSIRNALNMIRVSLSNDGASHGLNDTIPLPLGGALGWFLGARFGDPLGLWYGDHCLRWYENAERVRNDQLPYGPDLFSMLLFRPPLPESFDAPALPTVCVLKSIEMGMLRSTPQMGARWSVSLKGARPPFTHHNQADAGSFSVDLRGERLLLDPGYYKDKAEHHNLVLLKGKGPKPADDWSAPILGACEIGGIKVATLDSTQAYRNTARKVTRHFALVDEEALIILEEISLKDSASRDAVATHGVSEPLPQKWMFQAGGPTEKLKSGNGVLIRGRSSGMRVEWFSVVPPEVTLVPERSLKDAPWGYFFAEARWFPFSVGLSREPDSPVVWVLTDSNQAVSSGTQIRRRNDAIEVALPSGRNIVFSKEAPGWEARTAVQLGE